MEAVANFEQPDERILQESDVYVNYYGLSGDPFNPDNPLFFATPHLEKLHRLFNYLSRFSRKMVVVTGRPGAGKTALLEHFVQDQNGQDLVCYFAALKSDTPEQVLYEIADQLALGPFDAVMAAETVAEEIQRFSLARLDEGRSCIVVIDDAHLFELPVLEQLYQLTQEDSQTRCAIRVLLGGEASLLDHLREVVPADIVDKALYHQQISPFSRQEVQQYLQVHFRDNAGQSKPPFSAADYQRIHFESEGLPGRVNEVAKQIMAETINPLVSDSRSPKKAPLFTLVLVVVLMALGGVFWWQDAAQDEIPGLQVSTRSTGQIERTADEEPEAPDEERIFANSQPPETLANQQTSSDSERHIENASRQPVGELEGGVPSALAVETADSLVSPLQQVIPQEADPAPAFSADEKAVLREKEIQVTDVDLQERPSQASESGDVAQEVDTPASSDESLVRRHARQIQAMDRTSYTMQLLGSRNEESILSTLRKLPDDPNLLYFEKSHKGAPWYVLIYGNYPNRAEADKAAANLPKALSKLKPWVRGIASIQQEIVMPTR